MDSASNFRTFWAEEFKRREKKGGEEEEEGSQLRVARVRIYEVGSARAPKGFPWLTAGMKIDPRVPITLIRKDYSLVNFTNIFPVSTQGLDLSNSQ